VLETQASQCAGQAAQAATGPSKGDVARDRAPERESALEEIALFSEEYGARYPKVVEPLTKDQDQL
jgi:hypothetical protein